VKSWGYGLSALFLFSLLSGCLSGPEVRARLTWVQTQLSEVKRDGGRLCAPYTYAHAKAMADFTALELRQGQNVYATGYMKKAERWVKLAQKQMDVFRKRKELWKCKGLPRPRKPAPPPDPCAKDSDGDKINDCLDFCKNKPEDDNGYEDMDGCPDAKRDRDGDGIPDYKDKCPLEGEDINNFQDKDGCPDAGIDTDLDKVPDFEDKCPLQPGKRNSKTGRGCPDVALRDGVIKISQKIYFATARSRIRRRSYPILRLVSKFLRERGQLYVCVEGHTDNRGGVRYNLGLSRRRAASVRRFLVRAGISGRRIRSRGYGMKYPIDTNRTRSGRARNRRVEFHVVKKGDPCPRDNK
jgi:outer membrane protein OmpA-like peptidoglycan-associated protein